MLSPCQDSWFSKDSNTNFNLEGYQTFYETSCSSLKGGCGLFVHNDLTFKTSTDLDTRYGDDKHAGLKLITQKPSPRYRSSILSPS